MELYPLKLVPIFKHRLWGGQKLRKVFRKDIPADDTIGESWELADLPQDKSVIANGAFAGQTLQSLIRQYPKEVTGSEDFALPFPLLIKLLDAQDILSVQVHPDPATCRRMGKGDPKTECWYIIQAEPGAVIYKGLRHGVTKDVFAQAIKDGTAAELLEAVEVHAGECHFLPAGTVHSIGAGILIAEIQTPSDTTYRVFDFNRLDKDGQPRPLHVAEALESIHFDVGPDDLAVTTIGRLVDCEYFKLHKGHQAPGCELLLARGQMRTLIFLSGGGTIFSARAATTAVAAGDCVLVPAAYEGAIRFADDTEYLTVTL